MRRPSRVALLAGFALLVSTPALPQSAGNVLVVLNAESPASIRIGEHYAARRGVPAEQVLRLTTLPAEPADGIDRLVYERDIQAPVARWLSQHQAQDRILFIVLTKGIPLRINGTAADRSAASVDSELAMLYQRLTGARVPLAGPWPNPYFLGDRPISEARRFRREDQSIYLVTRLDGYTVEDVIGLIDRGAAPSTVGRFVLDGKASWTDKGNQWLRDAAERLKAGGLPDDRVVLDATATVLTDLDDVLGYYSWGSNDPAIKRRTFALTFRPGAIGGMFVSTDGRTFSEPPADWAIGDWKDKTKWHAGSPQSLAGDLIRAGITGVAGHVSEPLLGHTIRPNVLFPAYVAGFTLAEAYYLAMPSLSWMTVVVGDPLCAPLGAKTTSSTDGAPAIDPATELPAVFSERVLGVMADLKMPVEARKLVVRARVRAERNDPRARQDLIAAVTLAPDLLAAQYTLAAMYEAEKDFDSALRVYRTIIERSPGEVLAMNNLAYGLAVHRGALDEALPLAEGAWRLSPRSGPVADTLGWIYLMRGDVGRGRPLLQEAVRLAPANAEIRLHLAQAHLAAGDRAACDKELAAALALAPALRTRPEVVLLLQKP